MHRRGLALSALLLVACERALPTPEDGSPPVGVQAAGLCGSLPVRSPDEVVLASVQGRYGAMQALRLVRADGTSFVAARFGEERMGDDSYIYISDVELVVDERYILATRHTDGAVLFDRAGQEIARARHREELRPLLLARGAFTLTDAIDGWTVLGQVPSGQLAVERWSEAGAWVRGWMDPDSRAVQALDGSAAPTTLVFSQDAFAGVGLRDGAPVLVRFRVDGAAAIPLPGYRGEPNVQIAEVVGRWARLWSYEADREWIADLGVLSIRPVDKQVPSGLEAFQPDALPGDHRLDCRLAEDGGLLARFRDGSSAGLYHSADGAHGWARIGDLVTRVRFVSGYSRSGTFVVDAGEDVGWSDRIAPWEPPVGIAGSSTQVVRAGVARTLPAGSAVHTGGLSRNGLCVGYQGRAADGQLTTPFSVFDLASGVVQPIDGVGRWGARFID